MHDSERQESDIELAEAVAIIGADADVVRALSTDGPFALRDGRLSQRQVLGISLVLKLSRSLGDQDAVAIAMRAMAECDADSHRALVVAWPENNDRPVSCWSSDLSADTLAHSAQPLMLIPADNMARVVRHLVSLHRVTTARPN